MKIVYKGFALAVFVAASASSGISASDGQAKMNIVSVNGIPTDVDLTKIGKITFDGDHLMVHMADGSREAMAIKDVDHLKFDFEITTSGEERIEAEVNKDIHIIVENNVMSITELSNKQINVMVFNTNGVQLLATNAIGSLQVDFNGLNPGVYIIKANDKVIKYVK